MKLIVFLSVLATALAATVVDPDDCTEFPCLIFEDEFDTLDHDVWEHEITLGGGGNWEFQAYVNNRSISYVRDSTLYIKPGLVRDWQSEEFITSGTFSVWGSQGRNDLCTGNFYYGCERVGTATNPVNPILSARLRTLGKFAVRYGSVEVRAKTPRGDWLWPAIWMMPENHPYGTWPASGEIDILESRGNDDFGTIGNEAAGSTLHWGPNYFLNRYPTTTQEYNTADGTDFPDAFHTWRVDWDDTSIAFFLDDVEQLRVEPGMSFWDYGGFADEADYDNPWAAGSDMAPFDQKFYMIMNVAVGGTGGYFPDGVDDDSKPWSNTESTAFLSFYNAIDQWLPTWQQGETKISEGAALQIDYIRIYKQTNSEM